MQVSLYIEGLGAHTSQVYTGYGLLEQSGLVRLQFYKGHHFRPGRGVVCAEMAGKKVVYEMGDNPLQVMQEYYDGADVYFKRMATPSLIDQYPKIVPYGFNYPVYHHHDHFFKRAVTAGNKPAMLRALLNQYPKLAALGGISTHASASGLHLQEALPNTLLPPKIIFSARLWNNQTTEEHKDKERTTINQQRIAIVRKLKEHFGSRFIGGIEDDALARQQCPDLILPKNVFTQKSSYINHLRHCTIGIATPGLETSVGFKFAEYIAFSKAIISTPVQAVVPGHFAAGKNYVSYTTAEECVEAVHQLMTSKHATHQMMEENYNYYHQYLRPDKLVWNSILRVMDPYSM